MTCVIREGDKKSHDTEKKDRKRLTWTYDQNRLLQRDFHLFLVTHDKDRNHCQQSRLLLNERWTRGGLHDSPSWGSKRRMSCPLTAVHPLVLMDDSKQLISLWLHRRPAFLSIFGQMHCLSKTLHSKCCCRCFHFVGKKKKTKTHENNKMWISFQRKRGTNYFRKFKECKIIEEEGCFRDEFENRTPDLLLISIFENYISSAHMQVIIVVVSSWKAWCWHEDVVLTLTFHWKVVSDHMCDSGEKLSVDPFLFKSDSCFIDQMCLLQRQVVEQLCSPWLVCLGIGGESDKQHQALKSVMNPTGSRWLTIWILLCFLHESDSNVVVLLLLSLDYLFRFLEK